MTVDDTNLPNLNPGPKLKKNTSYKDKDKLPKLTQSSQTCHPTRLEERFSYLGQRFSPFFTWQHAETIPQHHPTMR